MELSPAPEAGSPEIAFFDVETTIPASRGEGYALLEFGAIVVCPRRLTEMESFTTLIRPADPNAISAASTRCNGITREAVASAPAFREVADKVFSILHGRVWAGHNIVRFDCARVREAFSEIGRAPPEPKGMIDTLPLLTQRFGRRAGNMKMASLATYFGLGQQKHRSLDDVRMNLEVLKYCATVLLLESSLADVSSTNALVGQSVIERDQGEETEGANRSSPLDPSGSQQNLSPIGRKTILEVNDQASSSMPASNMDPSDLMTHIEQMKIDAVQTDATMFRRSAPNSDEMFCTTVPIPSSEGSSGFAGFLEPDEVSTHYVSAPAVPFQGGQKILLLHRDLPLQLCCLGLRVHFGLSTKFMDHAGRPKLSFVVDAPEGLCRVLDACDHIAQRSVQNSGSRSEWRSVVRKNGYSNSSTIRLHIPTVANDIATVYSTEMYQKDPAGNIQKLAFNKINAAGLDWLFVPGNTLDAFFSVDLYDYQQNAGLRLVTRKLVFHTK